MLEMHYRGVNVLDAVVGPWPNRYDVALRETLERMDILVNVAPEALAKQSDVEPFKVAEKARVNDKLYLVVEKESSTAQNQHPQ